MRERYLNYPDGKNTFRAEMRKFKEIPEMSRTKYLDP